jgi:aminoglycoside phosphotransferase (APT) family kinase protein
MKFQDGGSAVIRFPKPGITMFPEEKIRNEVAMIRYIQDHTTIPVPFILHWGTKEESPLQLGPFIIMEYINHEMDMGAALNTPGRNAQERPHLDPNIDPAKLEMLYRQVADILLQLSRLEFPAIGSLEQSGESSWEATYRPLSIHMNELVRLGTLPRSKLPKGNFKSSLDYFESLSQLHIEHLFWQRNDAVESQVDCQRKYVARQLFQKLVSEKKLSSSVYNNGPFKIWCDDLRPSNILLDENLQIVGVIDWEFAYAAPAEFSFAPPWWLLLEQPEYWPNGINEWTNIYETRLQTFLKLMEECEASAIASGRLRDDGRLSCRMRKSWDDGDFWIVYGARKNFAFDAIFWQKLDPKFFWAR